MERTRRRDAATLTTNGREYEMHNPNWLGPGGQPRQRNAAPPALEPIILGEDIISTARLWRDGSVAAWAQGQPDVLFRIGEANVISPVDQQARPVSCYLVTWNNGPHTARGLTVPPGGDIAPGRIAPDRTRSRVLINTFIPHDGNLLEVILHELTHVVDPCLIEDLHPAEYDPRLWEDDDGELPNDYELPSERHAFVSMWIERIRVAVNDRAFRDPKSFAEALLHECHEFGGFYADSIRRPRPWVDQVHEHLGAIAAHYGWVADRDQ
jgi:hypothetical protein